MHLLEQPSRYMFFTGKGGVGKTSISSAVALNLADAGKKVLLVSTDPASNLDEMLGVELSNRPIEVMNAQGLYVLNIDPNNAADAYRQRVIAQMKSDDVEEVGKVKEELSGACTTEIAAFDEFAGLLANAHHEFDHIIFDTAPTGHTLRLLSLPKAWTGFLNNNDRGASCLGPHSGLVMQKTLFERALKTLSDQDQTTIILVTRPEMGAALEASRTSEELKELGLTNQRLIINGVFIASKADDEVAKSIEKLGASVIENLPVNLKILPTDKVFLRSFNTVGLEALRSLLKSDMSFKQELKEIVLNNLEELDKLVDELACTEHGLIMVMGKGGVGKTTIAAAVALGLLQRGKTVHLSTTDPAAHILQTIEEEVSGLKIDAIDPKYETQKYIEKMLKTKGAKLSLEEKALMQEDLKSPCTEEVAVFHAFSRIVSEAQSSFVVLDTAPTGHSLLLMDATGAYHRQAVRDLNKAGIEKIKTPLTRLQNADYTKIIIVTLAENTPVSQATALQNDLRRAHIEPYAWVINKSILGSGTEDPLLKARELTESIQVERIKNQLAKKLFILPWKSTPPVGIKALSKLVSKNSATSALSTNKLR